jgi:hypothetical protein
MKLTLISIAVAALVIGTTTASVQAQTNEKHFSGQRVYAHGHRHAPPAYVHGPRGYYAPRHYVSYDRHHHGRGYWRDGRWIAPLAVGLTVGAIAASAPVYAAPVYSAPVYTAPVNYYTPGDRFSWADVNNDGYLSYHEARRFGGLHRNFAAIDWNGDGYLSRSEVDAWRHGW